MKINLDKDFLYTDDATVSGDFTQANPFTVVPQITTITHDLTLTGSGTVQSPLSVTAPGISGIEVKEIDGSPDVTGVKIIQVSNGTLTDNGSNTVTITTGGGGSSPGGSNQQVQFNNNGSFAGDSAFKWDAVNNILTLDGGLSGNVEITGGTNGLLIDSADNPNAGGTTGSVTITVGSATADDGTPGILTIQGGTSGNGFNNGANPGGDVQIFAGNTRTSTGGNLILRTGLANGIGGTAGVMKLQLNKGTSSSYFFFTNLTGNFGTVPNIFIGRTTDTPSFGSGNGVIEFRNGANIPTTNPTNGGLIYVEGGALKYRGSSGTVTQIAPA